MVDYETAVNNLFSNYPDAIAAAIIDGGGNIVYSTSNWDIKDDKDKLLNSWKSGNAQFVMLQGVKYSILQCVPERLIATNFSKQGHLIGASTPDQQYKMIVYISPDAQGWQHVAYPMVARAVAMLVGASSISETASINVNAKQNSYNSQIVNSSGTNVDPVLKAEIESFLQWIRDPQGLAGYIEYYLSQNNYDIIQKLASVYNDFRRIFNF